MSTKIFERIPGTFDRCNNCGKEKSEGHLKLKWDNGKFDLYLYLCANCMKRAAELLENL